MVSRKVAGLTAAVAMVAGSFVVAGTVGESAGASATDQAAKSRVDRPARVGDDVFGRSVAVAPGNNGIARATCPRGTTLTGGGGATSGIDIFFTDSFRERGRTWLVRGTNTGASTQNITAFARCL